MKFSEAMKALEEGKSVRCLDWEKDNIFPASPLEGEEGVLKIRIDFDSLIKTEWEIYEEPKPTYSFMEIVPLIKEGKIFKRSYWGDCRFLLRDDYDLVRINFDSGSPWHLSIVDLEAKDWIEVKK